MHQSPTYQRCDCTGESAKELITLQAVFDKLDCRIDETLLQKLGNINQELWHVEDKIRNIERNNDFSENFIQIAGSALSNE